MGLLQTSKPGLVLTSAAGGIGTQALGLASAGFAIEGTDLSSAVVESESSHPVGPIGLLKSTP